MEERDKSIDQNWKEKTEKEKETINSQEEFIPPKPDFPFFISTLAIQASISLGAMPNPATNKTEENLHQGKFLIDTIDMLKEKTQGNLSTEESSLLDNILYELKMQYVAKTKEK
jgi:uncharacterized protein YjaG (DUF416 family)